MLQPWRCPAGVLSWYDQTGMNAFEIFIIFFLREILEDGIVYITCFLVFVQINLHQVSYTNNYFYVYDTSKIQYFANHTTLK